MSFCPRTRPWLAFGSAVALAATFGPAYSAAAVAPSNDDVAQAVVVTGLGFTASADTREATYVSTEPECGAATVWYSFTPGTDGRVAFDNIGSDYDTMLGVSTGSPANLELVACHDDDVGLNEQIVLDVTAGTTYYIQAGSCCEATDGQVGPGGSMALNVSTPPPAMVLGATVNRRAVLNRFGEARVRGSLLCHPEATWAEIGVRIRQRQGSRVVTAWGSKSVQCTEIRRTWTVKLANESWSFRRRLAQVTVYATACDSFTCDDATRQRRVRLGSHF